MIKKFFLMIFVIMTTLGFGQANLLMEGSILPKEYTETISFEIDQNYIVLPVEIEGKKYRFLFDTGAVNILNSTVFSKFKSINSVKISDTNSKREETNILSVPIFKLGNLTFQDYKFLDYNFSKNYIFNCLNFDGIIGSNSLKDSVIKIDYQNKKLIISNSKDNIQTSGKPEEMKLLGAGKSPFLLIKLSGKDSAKESVLFDSGFRNFYLQSERAYNLIKTKRIYQNVVTSQAQLAMGLLGLEPIAEKSFFTIPNFQLGKVEFKNVNAYFNSSENSLLGVEILKYGSLILDFPNSKYYFEPLQNKIDLTEEFPLYKPVFDNQKIRVGMIINEKLRKSISVGDIITSIDGKRFDTIDCETVFNLKPGKESLTVLHNNQEVTINLKDFQ